MFSRQAPGWIRGAEGINEFATDPDLIAALDDKDLFGQILNDGNIEDMCKKVLK